MFTLTDVVNTTVIVEMVVDQVYKEAYDDNNSPEYKDFVKNFTAQVSKIAGIVNIYGTMIDISISSNDKKKWDSSILGFGLWCSIEHEQSPSSPPWHPAV